MSVLLNSTVPDSFIWIARHPDVQSKEDTRIVVLRKPGMHAPLNPTKSEILREYASPEELFGNGGFLSVNMLQDPKHLSINELMYPRLYEIACHLDFKLSPFAGFYLEEIPALDMSTKKIETEYSHCGKKIPFRVRLFCCR
ncbi:MAG: hypothetical protein RLY49_214 [Candidatus Parcubacteria bacterium]|jgi:hypothetical protein